MERVQNKSARWTRGEYGAMSITQLLRELHWALLADRRRHSRLILIYKILNALAAVPPADIDIVLAERGHGKDHQKIDCPRAPHKHSPLFGIPPLSAQFPSGKVSLQLQQRPTPLALSRIGWWRSHPSVCPPSPSSAC